MVIPLILPGKPPYVPASASHVVTFLLVVPGYAIKDFSRYHPSPTPHVSGKQWPVLTEAVRLPGGGLQTWQRWGSTHSSSTFAATSSIPQVR